MIELVDQFKPVTKEPDHKALLFLTNQTRLIEAYTFKDNRFVFETPRPCCLITFSSDCKLTTHRLTVLCL